MKTTLRNFDRKGWISRFGRALEDAATEADPTGVPLNMYGLVESGLYRMEQHRRYRDMATLAKTDAYAAKLFDESHLWLDSLPDGVQDLLLEHPVMKQAWSGGSREGFYRVRGPAGGGHADVQFLIANLAKLAVKVGGPYAATMLHRYLVAGEGVRLHAHEIMVLHGLKVDDPIPLGPGTYLSAYDAVRKRFGLPEDPEPWLRPRDEGLDLHPGRLARASSRTVLVRQVRWGPAVAPRDTAPDSACKLQYRFPIDHTVESLAKFEERDALLRLLSIAVRSQLVCHTVIEAMPPWMAQLDPNLQTAPAGGGRGLFDVWPKDRVPTLEELDAFAAAARGWLTYCAGERDRSTELAIRRTAAAFGIPGGRFGVEDRLIDVSIALEAMYGPYHDEIRHKISSRAAWLLGDSARKKMKSFYRTRSKVVHGTISRDPRRRERELASALDSGRELARRTLFALLVRGPISNERQWDVLVSAGATGASAP